MIFFGKTRAQAGFSNDLSLYFTEMWIVLNILSREKPCQEHVKTSKILRGENGGQKFPLGELWDKKT